MEKTNHITFQSAIFTFIPLLFILSCQKRTVVESENNNVSEVSKTDTENLKNVENIQSPELFKQEEKIINTFQNPSIIIKNAEAVDPSRIIYCNPEPVSYPGGEKELLAFIDMNNSYNKQKYFESIEGIVYLKLLIDSTGKVLGSNILRGVGLGIDEEAIRLAGLLKFLPAKDSNCNAILSDFTLKVNFKKPYYRTVIIKDTSYTADCRLIDKILKDAWHLRKSANPHFIGGKIKMKSFLKKNLIYSDELKNEYIEGKVKMMLQINEHGRLLNISVYESAEPRLTKESIRALNSVSYWHPAILNHRHANGYMKVTIKFKTPRKQLMLLNHKRN